MRKTGYFSLLGISLIILLVAFPLTVEATIGQKSSTPSTREMNFLCWQEFQELVPSKIQTVLLPIGSLEPHGVIPNGTDNLAPEAMARAIAEKVNALIAPTLNYGVTPAMKAYPGAVSIRAAAYQPFVEDILTNLAANGFRNIIILNGHGGNTEILQELSRQVANRCRVRILVVNWWTLADKLTKEVFRENGGHAGNNETAYIQAVYPQYIHPERYSPHMASPLPQGNSYYAVPVPSSILLYEKGQGYPNFNKQQAQEYFRKVNELVAKLILDIIHKWDLAGVYCK